MMKRQWTKEEAFEWQNSRPWICGFNYTAANCVNRMEMWQEFEHAEKVPVFERELKMASEHGFNSVRVVLPFECWYYQHDGFMARLEEFIGICAKNGLGVMIVFGNDCTVPKDLYVAPYFGPQKVDWGYHGGMAKSPHAVKTEAGYSILDEPELCDAFCEMVRDIVGAHADDPRIDVWDIFNEIGNGRREMRSVAAMERFFEAARSADPIQPLTACVWTVDPAKDDPLKPWERRALELSDVISYHDYRRYDYSVQLIDYLKSFGRPLLNTEWLHRIQGNTVQTHLPLFWLEHIGCYNWGFVAGKSQTYEPWEANWTRYYNGTQPNLDFTKWQHDLFRPNLRPYDPKEIDLFEKYIGLARKKFCASK